MREYYEELWEELPDDLTPADFERRRRFLVGDLAPGLRVLDVGCGDGRFAEVVVGQGGVVTGVDVAEAALRRARARCPRGTFARVEFDGRLPFDDGSFELAWAGEVIEHVADTARWLSEIRRVLSPQGRLLLTTPSHGRLAIALHGIERYSEPLGDHLHLYTRRSMTATLQDFGFAQIEVRAVGGPPLLKRMLLARATR